MKKVNRRQYLRSLFANTLAAVDELRGEPQFRLDEIASLPDAVLHGMTPVVFQGMTVRTADGWLLLQKSPDAPFERLTPLTGPQAYAVNRFDGSHSVAVICAEMEPAFGLSSEAASDLVKSLFVTLAENGICHPRDRPE
jgi:hypothetical protein